jgi:hypothetical protein
MRAQNPRSAGRLKAQLKARTRSPAFTRRSALTSPSIPPRPGPEAVQGLGAGHRRRSSAGAAALLRTVRFRVLPRRDTRHMPTARARDDGLTSPGATAGWSIAGPARREAIRAAVLRPGAGGPTARSHPTAPPLPTARRRRTGQPDDNASPGIVASRPAGARHERLIDLEEVRDRLGGIGSTLARRVLDDLPVIRLGDRVLVREFSLDEYICELDAQARRQRCTP